MGMEVNSQGRDYIQSKSSIVLKTELKKHQNVKGDAPQGNVDHSSPYSHNLLDTANLAC